MLPNPLEEIARRLDEYNKRLSHLERLEVGGAWTLIENETLVAPVASLTFAAISNTFAHLLLLYYTRSAFAGLADAVAVRFNGDAGANYDSLLSREQQPATLTTIESIASTSMFVGNIAAATAPAGFFDGGMIMIPHYTNTVGQKTLHSLFDYRFGIATGNVRNGQSGGFWRNTAAITSVTVLTSSVANFIVGSRFSLYGIRG